jgi:plastocyanin
MFRRRKLIITWALAALLLGACGRAVEAKGNVGKGSAAGNAIEVAAEDNEFKPEVIRAKSGEEVTVEIVNRGSTDHNFVVPEIDLSTGTIQPGEVVTATFVMPDSRTEFVCTFHGGMKGELVPA